jgi:acetate kinase
LHLGNGVSACAIDGGCSVDTSMGMTALQGLVMGTRSGDIDPGVLLFLQQVQGWTVDQLHQLLYHESGLLGVSGLSHDLRQLEAAAAAGHPRAQLAIDLFAYRARQYVGAYAAVLGGLDAVLFTAGMGENSPAMRSRIVAPLAFLGCRVDESMNASARVSRSHPVVQIQVKDATVALLVVKTNEEWMIAQQTAQLV